MSKYLLQTNLLQALRLLGARGRVGAADDHQMHATLAQSMKPSLLYRIASILLILFAVGHTFGFRQVDPKWGVDSLIQSMRSVHFSVNGFERTYLDFFVGFGFFVTALMVFAAIVAWQLGSVSAETLASMRISAWGFVLCFAFVALLSWRYFFLVPIIFSIAILICLTLAAWLSGASR
jgi:hypothetical protein